jgi:hypothetical protein
MNARNQSAATSSGDLGERMRRRATRIGLMVLVVCGMGPAVADDLASHLKARSEAAAIGEETVATMLALVETAQGQGLPTEPLAAKYLEGLSKSIPEARVLAAVRTVRARLERSQDILAEAVDSGAVGPVRSEDIVRVASGITAGVSTDEIARLVEAAAEAGAPVSRIGIAVASLERLRGMGVFETAAVDALAASLSAGRREADLTRLAEDYRRHAQAGGTAEGFFEDSQDWAHEGLSGTDLGHDAAARFGDGRLPDEPGGETGSLVPGNEGLGDRDDDEDDDDPYAPDRNDPRDAFAPDDPEEERPLIRRP